MLVNLKRTAALLIVFVLMAFNMAYAISSPVLSDFNASVNYDTKTVNIKAVSSVNDIMAMVLVLKPSKTIENMTDSDSVLYQKSVQIDTDGNLNLSFPFVLDESVTEENYGIYIKLPLNSAEYLGDLIYPSLNKMKEIINIFKSNSENAINSFLGNNAESSYLGLNEYIPFKEADKSKITTIILGKTSVLTEDQEGFEALRKLIKECSILVGFNDVKTNLLFDGNADFIYDSDIALSKVDEKYNTSVYEFYKTEMTTEGKNKVHNAISGKNFSDVESLEKAFIERIMLYGLTNFKSTGYAHVEKLLSPKNLTVVNKTLSAMLNDTREIALSTYVSDFESFDVLNAFILSVTVPGTQNGTTSGSISSGSSSGGKVSGSVSVSSGYNGNTASVEEKEEKVYIFSDLSDEHWASKQIYYLKDKGIISGNDKGEFMADNFITREQFAKIICLAFGIDADKTAEVDFSDVDKESWYYSYVSALKNEGIISGISEDLFGTGKNISREDLCVMIYRASGDDIKSESEEKFTFTDAKEISDYAYEAVKALSEKGILKGYEDGSFCPKKTCTRAEAAKIIYETLLAIDYI